MRLSLSVIVVYCVAWKCIWQDTTSIESFLRKLRKFGFAARVMCKDS